MKAKNYQEIQPRMLNQKQGEEYTGLGRATFTSFADEIGARRKIGRRVLYDRTVIDRAFDQMQASNSQE